MTSPLLRKRLTLALLAMASLATLPAQAHGPRGYGHYPGPVYRSHIHYGPNPWWWVAGTGLLLYPQVVTPRPQVIVQSPPVEPIIVQPQPAAQNWYYCDSAQAYYPYAQSCAEGWRAVPATPTAAAQPAFAQGQVALAAQLVHCLLDHHVERLADERRVLVKRLGLVVAADHAAVVTVPPTWRADRA